jgi:hypothetical protein
MKTPVYMIRNENGVRTKTLVEDAEVIYDTPQVPPLTPKTKPISYWSMFGLLAFFFGCFAWGFLSFFLGFRRPRRRRRRFLI